MKVVPLGEHVVVRRFAPEESTRGGIVLPSVAQQQPQQGRVLSVGDGRTVARGRRAHPLVGEGDHVLFRHYAGVEVTVDGEPLLILNEGEILAVIR